jgi:glycosyltransferase involved in cell wall biosynthesis
VKVLLVHNHYQWVGGEDQSFEDEARLLQANGHHVLRYTVHNKEIPAMNRAALAMRTLWNRKVYRALHALLQGERPAVMHCTNIFPLISPSAYFAAQREGVAVVQSLRNYRLLCPGALFLRNRKPCEDCLGKRFAWPALVHRCYREELPATAVLASMNAIHGTAGTWRSAVDLFFTPSEFARNKFIQGGFDAQRIAVKPNFVFPDAGAGDGSAGGAIFVGRLSEEKGVQVLLDAWLHHDIRMTLRIVGDGPLWETVEAACRKSSRIVWLEQLPHAEALAHVGRASLLIAPSITYETFGRTVVEAFAKGTPVLTSDSGASAELITSGINGELFRAGDAADLAAKVNELSADPSLLQRMREAARHEYLRKYNGEMNLIEIYERAIALRNGKPVAEAASEPLPTIRQSPISRPAAASASSR